MGRASENLRCFWGRAVLRNGPGRKSGICARRRTADRRKAPAKAGWFWFLCPRGCPCFAEGHTTRFGGGGSSTRASQSVKTEATMNSRAGRSLRNSAARIMDGHSGDRLGAEKRIEIGAIRPGVVRTGFCGRIFRGTPRNRRPRPRPCTRRAGSWPKEGQGGYGRSCGRFSVGDGAV